MISSLLPCHFYSSDDTLAPFADDGTVLVPNFLLAAEINANGFEFSRDWGRQPQMICNAVIIMVHVYRMYMCAPGIRLIFINNWELGRGKAISGGLVINKALEALDHPLPRYKDRRDMM